MDEPSPSVPGDRVIGLFILPHRIKMRLDQSDQAERCFLLAPAGSSTIDDFLKSCPLAHVDVLDAMMKSDVGNYDKRLKKRCLAL